MDSERKSPNTKLRTFLAVRIPYNNHRRVHITYGVTVAVFVFLINLWKEKAVKTKSANDLLIFIKVFYFRLAAIIFCNNGHNILEFFNVS